MWHTIYEEFKTKVKLEMWSGADALVMPHFSTVLENEKLQYKDAILNVLYDKFHSKKLVHRDVYWRNIGKYLTDDGVSLVVFDLQSVTKYDDTKLEHQD